MLWRLICAARRRRSGLSLLRICNTLRYHLRLINLVVSERAIAYVIGLIYLAFLFSVIEGLLIKCVAARYILTAHDLLPHDRHTLWNRLIYQWLYRLADRVVVHTAKMKADLVQMHHLKPDRVVVVGHGIEHLGKEGRVRTPKLEDALFQIRFSAK